MVKRTAALFIAALMCFMISFKKNPHPGQKPSLRTIIVDAGHGGNHPGTKGLISKEKDVTLDIAMKLGDAIQKQIPDVKVLYTRTTDQETNGETASSANRYRAEFANKSKADLFLSIHCNATREPAGGWYAKRVIGHKKVLRYVGKGKKKRKKLVNEPIYESYWVKNTRNGTETYIWAADRAGSKSDFINQTEGSEFSGDSTGTQEVEAEDMSTPEAKFRAQLYEQKFFKKSALLASYVEDEFAKSGRVSNGVKQRTWEGIWVLQATGMPSILVETGFLSNKEEEEYLNSDKGQDEVVQDIVDALKRYKQQIEGTRISTPIQTDSTR